MTMRVILISVAFVVTSCSRQGPVTETERREAIAGISVVVDSMNAAWRRADFAASDRPLLDEGLTTFNGSREPSSASKTFDANHPTTDFAGQYISNYTPRYDILTPELAVTSSENDYARISLDSTRQPMQVALMTLVWKRTSDGWRILHYHESTRPKAREATGELLAQYAGSYQRTDGSDLRVALAGGALSVTMGQGQPISMMPFTDPNFGTDDARMTFVRNRDGTVHGVLLTRQDGSSSYAWRVSAVVGR